MLRMAEMFKEDVYLTLQGVIVREARVNGVENAFEEGSPCAKHYANMLHAYSRLCTRLGVPGEDPDVEEIICSLMSITEILAYKMYEYGAIFEQKKQK